MKKLFKLALISVASVASFGALAQAATCGEKSGSVTASASGAKYEYAEPTAGSVCYMQSKFTANVSSNVGLNWVQNTTAVAVQTASTKGRNNFSGSSEGGRVSTCGKATSGSKAPELGTPDLEKPNGCAAK